MGKNHPPWLKAMQNGTIAEARSRAFLLDRFWVLERSVDIDGADFIIQRRLTNRNILDREAPRLGVVQVKFFGTSKTAHFVQKQYVINEKGELRSEFFLLCHTGNEENPRMFFLTSNDINEKFSISVKGENELFRIPYEKVVSTGHFEVTNRKRTLDRIEHQLELADFTQNRQFLSWALPSTKINIDAILPIYKEPIDNWWGDIPESFMEIKEAANSAIITIEGIYDLLRKVAEETDPLVAEEYLEDVAYECKDGLGRWSIPLTDQFDSPDFFTVCKHHRAMVEQLKEDGLLDAFIDIKKELIKEVVKFLTPLFPVDPNIVYRGILHYDPHTFIVKSISSAVIPATDFFKIPDKLNRFGHVAIDTSDYSGIDDAQLGIIDFHWLPGRVHIPDEKKSNLVAAYEELSFFFYQRCLDKIYELKYGDPLEL